MDGLETHKSSQHWLSEVQKNESFPNQPILMNNLWNGHVYHIQIVTYYKNNLSENYQTKAVLCKKMS